MAEIELRVLARRRLGCRCPIQAARAAEVAARAPARLATPSAIDWRVTIAAARITLKHLYPRTLDAADTHPANPA